jgi:hypothetical protein
MVKAKYHKTAVNPRSRAEKVTDFNTDKFKEEEIRRKFRAIFEEGFKERLSEENDIQSRWEGIKEVLKSTAEEIFGVRQKKQKKKNSSLMRNVKERLRTEVRQ